MRQSTLDFIFSVMKSRPGLFIHKDILETGALDVNGAIRLFIRPYSPRTYVATDMRAGEGVDVVCRAEDLPALSADLAISLDMLEHAEDWRAALLGLVGALRPGGHLLVTVPGPGFPRHDHPNDYQRFSAGTMRKIMEACGIEVIRCESASDWQSVTVNGKTLCVNCDSTNFLGKKSGNPNFGALASTEPEVVPDYEGRTVGASSMKAILEGGPRNGDSLDVHPHMMFLFFPDDDEIGISHKYGAGQIDATLDDEGLPTEVRRIYTFVESSTNG